MKEGCGFATESFLNIGGIESESIVDGPGLRYTVFIQGCNFCCPGCHNPHLQSFDGGRRIAISKIITDVKANPLLSGITLSGGDPFTQAASCAVLAKQIKSMNLNVMTYTGYLWEDLLSAANPAWRCLIEATDILVDGPFIRGLKDIDLRFRGSANQRLIDVQKSLAVKALIVLPAGTPAP